MTEKKHLRLWVRIVILCAAAVIVGAGGSIAIRAYNNYLLENKEKRKVMEAPILSELTEPEGSGAVLTELSAYSYTEPDVLGVSTSDYSELIAAVSPSVVTIECEATVMDYGFFGLPQEYKAKSGGTGFLIANTRDRIYIVTNDHVVSGADYISVSFCDGAEAEAEIVGADSYYDLAVISVNISELDPLVLDHIRIATLGDSDDVVVGDISIAIGNAMGLGISATYGYISALDRTVTVDNIDKELIQTDAAINPGNSGGPLIDVYGRVIGINSVKYAQVQVEGMGYAIPISYAIPAIRDLVVYEDLSEEEMGYLGIQGKDVNKSYANAFRMPEGVYIFDIDADSPAAASELRKGDIITAINGRTVKTMEELQNRIAHIRSGQMITITVSTSKRGEYVSHDVHVVLSDKPLE